MRMLEIKFVVIIIVAINLVQCEVIVFTQSGCVRGEIRKNHDGGEFFSFQSIPYAKPPLKELRFKAPRTYSWDGILDGTKKAPVCPQYSFRNIIGNEDCLYLNIYTTSLKWWYTLPVMFYIHGGGNLIGSGSGSVYGPEFFLTQEIVLVTINYRLGKLGSLSFKDQSQGVPGNAHLKDQVMALKWVQNNIEFFGGDKNKITVFGEGIGGSSTHLHTLSPMSRGLVHRAILQSGTTFNSWNLGVSGTGESLAKTLGITSQNVSEIIGILQHWPVDDLISKSQKSGPLYVDVNIRNEYGVVIESQTNELAFLPDTPENLIETSLTNIPMILGYNSKENILFQVTNRLYTGQPLFLNTINSTIPFDLNIPLEDRPIIIDQINATFFDSSSEQFQNVNKIIDYMLGPWFTAAIYKAVDLHLKQGHRQMYLYVFASDTKLNYFKRSYPITALYEGASHMDELGYLFTTDHTPCFDIGSKEDLSFRGLIKLWTNFAKYGNPFHGGSMEWPILKIEQPLAYALINGTNITIQQDPDKLVLNFWTNLYNKYNVKK